MSEAIEIGGIKIEVADWLAPNQFAMFSRDARGYLVIQGGHLVKGKRGEECRVVISAPLKIGDFSFSWDYLKRETLTLLTQTLEKMK